MKAHRPALLLTLVAACAAPAEDAGVNASEIESQAPGASSAPTVSTTIAEYVLTSWSSEHRCWDYFDYFPRGGIREFWCHRPSTLSIATVAEAAGVRIFASGPHPPGYLDLYAENDFGHYNPAFVRWLVDNGVPTQATPLMQALYDRKVKVLAEVFWKTLVKARAERACFEEEKAAYADLVANKALPRGYHERWFYFMNPQFCSHPPTAPYDPYLADHGFDAGVSGNVTKTVTGFWIRRALDGTMDTFAENLEKLVSVYDPALLHWTLPSQP